ncbi:MAG: hypothetical protein GY847_28370 [Proteobacteria bacterium]|nr:hypothetical protein [Pseudomonadota bacterium]
MGDVMASILIPPKPQMDNAVFVDFETYATDRYSITKMSSRQYIQDNRFDILCLAIADGDNGKVDFYHKFHAGNRSLEHARQRLATDATSGKWLVCHNSNFDALILRLRWDIQFKHLFDTVSYLRYLGLTASLNNGALYLGRKKGTAPPFTEESLRNAEKRREMAWYNATDVELCRIIFRTAIQDSVYSELETWLVDKTCRDNLRGIRIDVDRAQDLAEPFQRYREVALEELGAAYPDFDIDGINSPVKVKSFIKERWSISLKSISRKDNMLAKIRRKNSELDNFFNMRERVTSWGRGLKTTVNLANCTGRLYGYLNYYGAHTGRYSSGGRDSEKLNLQNLPGGKGKGFAELARLREIIVPEVGQSWRSADLSAIEAQVLAFLAREEDLLTRFRKGEDVYISFGEKAFPGKKIIKNGVNKHLRDLSKQAILGLGFGMGFDRFYSKLEAELDDPPDIETAQKLFDTYHNLYQNIRRLRDKYWACFVHAASNREESTWGYCQFKPLNDQSGHGVVVVLPTKRNLYYRSIAVDEKEWPNGGTSPQFWYAEGYSYDPKINAGPGRSPKRTKKFEDGRYRTSIYGQVLVENIVQAVARDILVGQMFILEEVEDARVALHVHDEIVAVSDQCLCFDGGVSGSTEEPELKRHRPDCPWIQSAEIVEKVMSAIPSFFEKLKGLPVACEVSGSIRERYGK